MQVRDFLLVMKRHWVLVIVAVFISAVATFATVALVGPTYQAKGATLLIPPAVTLRQTGTSASGNPYLALGGLTQARDLVVRSINAQATYLDICSAPGDSDYEAMQRELCGKDPHVTFEVTPDFNSNAPLVLVSVEANTPENAVTTLNVVMKRVPTALDALQHELNLRPNTDIASMPVVADSTPQLERKDQTRAGIVAGGGMLALGLLVIGLLDGWLTALAERRTTIRSAPVLDWSGSVADVAWKTPSVARDVQSDTSSDGWQLAAQTPSPVDDDAPDHRTSRITRLRERSVARGK